MRIPDRTILSILGWVLIMTCSCRGPEQMVSVECPDNGYPLLHIHHPHGEDISIEPSAGQGSIGIESEGETIWLRGEPELSYPDDNATICSWELPSGNRVELTFMRKGNIVDLDCRITGEMTGPGLLKWHLNLAAGEEEYFTGIFERVVDGAQEASWAEGIEEALDLRNQVVEMQVKPTVSAYAPFYLSSANYGMFVRTTWPGIYDFCKTDPHTVQLAFEGPSLEIRFYMGPDPASIVSAHTLDAGPPFVPPRWALGPWRWRDENVHREHYFDGSPVRAPYNSEIVEDVLMMEAYDIPFTAYWIDRPWGPGHFGFDDYDIDYERLPEFELMLEWLNSKDIELMLWICPWVCGDMYREAKERGYDLVSRQLQGPPPEDVDPAFRARFLEFRRQMEEMVLMDFSNPEACKWWGENGPGKLARMGVKGFKLDRADGERLVDSLHLFTASGKSYRENYNDYGRQFVKASYDAVSPVLGDDFVLFPRVQFTGSSRYGVMWAGDTGNPPEGLRSVLIGMQRCAVMGYPFWGSDTGGYPKRMDREVTIRWMGFSCFSPLMEVGPTNNRGFWGMDTEPSYDHELLAVWRFYSQLRMKLLDYLEELAQQAGETGMPVTRPLFLEYPDQEECWEDWTTYMLGEDLLVSVVWEKGKSSKKLFLPAGETWINLWDQSEYEGGQYVEVDAPLHQTPVFLRKGSELELPDFGKLYTESVDATAVRLNMSELEASESWKKK